MFSGEKGLTKLQLRLMLGHVESALESLDIYDLEITHMEQLGLRTQLESVKEDLESLVNVTEEEMEIEYLNEKFNDSE